MSLDFNSQAAKANEFINELAAHLHRPNDTDLAGRLLKAVLHTLRDTLSPQENLHVISQLPMFLKAVYVDGWSLKEQAYRVKNIDDFLARAREYDGNIAALDFGSDKTGKQIIHTVLHTFKNHISSGELQDMKAIMPQALQEIWEVEFTY